MSLLSVNEVVKEYQNRVVLNKVNLTVQKGDRVALIGSNGAGKTTLLKIINGTEKADSGSVTKARGIKTGYLSQSADMDDKYSDKTVLEYDKIDKIEDQLRDLENRMSDPESAGDYDSLLHEYQKRLDLFNSLDGYRVTSSLAKILYGLGLKKEAFKLPLANLSGGEKIRVALARILLENPELLILDEPTNHLDLEAVEWLESFLMQYNGGVLLVSHDRYFLDRVTTRIVELSNGTIVESKASGYTSYITQKREQQDFYQSEKRRITREIKDTRQLIQDLKSRSNVGAFHSREKTLERLNKSLDRITGSVRENHLTVDPALKFKEIDLVHVSAEIAYAKNFSKSFGTVKLFENAEFLIRGGERVGIVGPNGSGKTTLINILIGADTDYQGEIVLGEWVKYAYIGQTVAFRNEDATICEEVCQTFDLDRKEAQRILSDYGFYGNETDKQIGVLSGGEKVRLKLAMLLMNNPYCLIMDEPTNHLDADSRDQLELMISKYGGTVIAVSHDRYFLAHSMDRILEIKDYRFVSYPEGYARYSAERKRSPTVKQESEQLLNKPATRNIQLKRDQAPKEDNEVILELEALITEKENRLQQLCEKMSKEHNPEFYAEYGKLYKELEKLYEDL